MIQVKLIVFFYCNRTYLSVYTLWPNETKLISHDPCFCFQMKMWPTLNQLDMICENILDMWKYIILPQMWRASLPAEFIIYWDIPFNKTSNYFSGLPQKPPAVAVYFGVITSTKLIRLRMKANLQLYHSFCQSIPTPKPPGLMWMMQSLQRNPSQTVQSPAQLSSPDVPREPDVPLPGLKIMTYVEHLNIDLKILVEYWTVLLNTCNAQFLAATTFRHLKL